MRSQWGGTANGFGVAYGYEIMFWEKTGAEHVELRLLKAVEFVSLRHIRTHVFLGEYSHDHSCIYSRKAYQGAILCQALR